MSIFRCAAALTVSDNSICLKLKWSEQHKHHWRLIASHIRRHTPASAYWAHSCQRLALRGKLSKTYVSHTEWALTYYSNYLYLIKSFDAFSLIGKWTVLDSHSIFIDVENDQIMVNTKPVRIQHFLVHIYSFAIFLIECFSNDDSSDFGCSCSNLAQFGIS